MTPTQKKKKWSGYARLGRDTLVSWLYVAAALKLLFEFEIPFIQ